MWSMRSTCSVERARELGLRLGFAHRAAHECQRRLQAVCQVRERIAVALLLRALVREQRVEVVGEAPHLGGIVAGDLLLLPLLEPRDLVRDAAQRAQAPAQDQRLRREQQQRHRTEPAPQAAAIDAELLVVGLQVLRHAERERIAAARRRPAHAEALQKVAVPSAAGDLFEALAAGRQPRDRWQLDDSAPSANATPRGPRHRRWSRTGPSPASRARLRRTVADSVSWPLRVDLGGGHQQIHLGQQALLARAARAVAESALERESRQRDEYRRAPVPAPTATRALSERISVAEREAIASSAQRLQRLQRAVGIELAPQPPDQHLDHVAVALLVVRIQMRGQLVLRQHAPALAHQVLEQPVLVAR